MVSLWSTMVLVSALLVQLQVSAISVSVITSVVFWIRNCSGSRCRSQSQKQHCAEGADKGNTSRPHNPPLGSYQL